MAIHILSAKGTVSNCKQWTTIMVYIIYKNYEIMEYDWDTLEDVKQYYKIEAG